MRRKEQEPLSKVCMNLFEGDFAKLQDLHPDLGAGKVIRLIVRAYLKKIDARLAVSEQENGA